MTAKPFHKPDQQGRLDGLCAVYSVLNACKLLFDHSEKRDGELFEEVCEGLGSDYFPKIVYGGTGVAGVRAILKSARAWAAAEHRDWSLEWSQPCAPTTKSVDEYFDRLRAGIGAPGAKAAAWVVGLNVPWDHWTCVRALPGKSVRFYDSYGMKEYRRDAFTLDRREAGEGKGKRIMIDQHQSFLLRKVWRAGMAPTPKRTGPP